MRYYLPKGLTYNFIAPDYPAEALVQLRNLLRLAISQESDWGDDVPAGPTIRWVEYSHGDVGAGKAWADGKVQQLVPGRPNPFFEALDNATQDGCVLVRGDGGPTSLAYVEGELDKEWQHPSRQLFVVAAGGDCEGVPVWFQFDDPDAECPLSQTGETWQEWAQGAGSDYPVQHGEHWYRSSQDFSGETDSGRPINASVWVPAMLGGLVVLSADEFNAARAAVEVEP